MDPRSPKNVAFALALSGAVLCDQLSKHWARLHLRPLAPDAVSVVPGLFELRYSENPGVAFGMLGDLAGGRLLMLGFVVAALVVIAVTLRRGAAGAGGLGAALGLMAAGALGNAIDRVRFGRVVDFVVWRIGSHEWPTFNIADAALVVAVGLFALGASAPQTAAHNEPHAT